MQNFNISVTVCTAQDYYTETDFDAQYAQQVWGAVATHYVRATLTHNNYMQRFFAPIQNAVTATNTQQATHAVLQMLFADYSAYTAK